MILYLPYSSMPSRLLNGNETKQNGEEENISAAKVRFFFILTLSIITLVLEFHRGMPNRNVLPSGSVT